MSANDKTNVAIRRNSVLRPVLMVLAVFAVSLLTVGVLSFSGVEIPYFSAAFDNLAALYASGNNVNDAGSGGGSNNNGGGSSSGGGNSGGGSSSSSGNSGGGSSSSGGGSGGSNSNTPAGWTGGTPSELMGSGGAWDGVEIRLTALSLSYDVSEETEFCLYGKYLAECSRDSFYLLDKDRTDVFHKYVDFTKPMLYKRGDYLLVCDLGGRSAFVLKGAKLVWEDNFTSSIVNASINKNGYIAVVLEAEGYRNSVKILAPMGKAMFDWVVADDYVISSEVAPSGKELVINRLKTSGVSVYSGLEFLDTNPEPFMMIESGEDEVFLGVRYLDNNMIAIVSENVFHLYSEQGELLIQEKFDSIMAMCEFPRGKVSIAVRQNNRALVMEFDAGAPKGRVLYIADRPVINLSADNEYLFVNLGHEVTVIKENGDIALSLTLDSEALYGGASEKFGILAVTKKSADIYPFE